MNFPSTDLPRLKDEADTTAVRKSILDLLEKVNTLAKAFNVNTDHVSIGQDVTIGSPVVIPNNTTGGIYDSGTNANGSWIRFTDGTMACWGTNTLSATESSTTGRFDSTGTTYFRNAAITLPMSFIDTTYAVSIEQDGFYQATSQGSKSTSAFSGYIFYGSIGSFATWTCTWQAIGKWK